MGSQLALKSRIHSTESLAKIFNAQEMIASSHIAKARDVALNAKPVLPMRFSMPCKRWWPTPISRIRLR
ncbi:hypothetical protein [Bifidobacterium longum]|uniref:hypothetical protein n=1 Tax=Bifidobacterium longum TaxID=216816 RepID=UPI001F369598|nr:hypothetical protein [Bifidobacterium longum]